MKRIKENKDFLFCGECGKNIIIQIADKEVMPNKHNQETVNREIAVTRLRTTFESALGRLKRLVHDQNQSIKSPSCFISYAWGVKEHEQWVRKLANDLRNAGIEIILDQLDNQAIGSSVSRFISSIPDADFIAVVGTPLYKDKYENKVSKTGSVVAAEVDLINLRFISTEDKKRTILPLLLEDECETSFPPLMQGRVYSDFRQEIFYFVHLFDLLLTLYRISPSDRAIRELQDNLNKDAMKIGGLKHG